MMLMTDRAEEHGLGWCLASHTPATTERLRVGARAFYDPTITLDAGPTAAERERETALEGFRESFGSKKFRPLKFAPPAFSLSFCPQSCSVGDFSVSGAFYMPPLPPHQLKPTLCKFTVQRSTFKWKQARLGTRVRFDIMSFLQVASK